MTNYPHLCQKPLPKDDLLDENEKELIQSVSLIEDSESDHAAGDEAAVQGTFLQSEDDQERDDEADKQSSTSSPSDSWEKSMAKISKLRAQQPRHSLSKDSWSCLVLE